MKQPKKPSRHFLKLIMLLGGLGLTYIGLPPAASTALVDTASQFFTK
jgi:hypothetical protein